MVNSQKVHFKRGRPGIARKSANLRNKSPAFSSKAYYLELKKNLQECGPQITNSLSHQDIVPGEKSPVADKE